MGSATINKTAGKFGGFLFVYPLFAIFLVLSNLCQAVEKDDIFVVIQPESGILVSSNSISVVGRVADSVVLKSLRVNNEELNIPSVPGFSFNIEVGLKRGANDISIVAVSEDGMTQEESLSILRDDLPPGLEVEVSIVADSDGKRVARVNAVMTEEFSRLSSVYFDGEVVELPSESKVFFITKKVPIEKMNVSISGGDAAGNNVIWDVNLQSGKAVARIPTTTEKQLEWEAPMIPSPEAVERVVEKPKQEKTPQKQPEIPLSEVNVSLNGNDFYSIASLHSKEGRTYISVENLVDVLPGGKLEEAEGVIRVVSGKPRKTDEITLKSGQTEILVNGESLEIGSPVSVSDDQYELPLRKVFQALGYDVVWLHEKKTVVLKREDKEVVAEEEPAPEEVEATGEAEYGWSPPDVVEDEAKEEHAKVAEESIKTGFMFWMSHFGQSSFTVKLALLAAIILMIFLAIKIVPVVVSSNLTRETRQRQRETFQVKRLRPHVKTLVREVYTADKLSAIGETERLAIFNKMAGKISIGEEEQEEVFSHFSMIIRKILDEDAYMNARVSISAVEDRSFKGLLVSRFELDGVLRRRKTLSQDYLWFTSGGKWVCRQRVAEGRQVEVEYARGVKPWDEEG